MMRTKSNTSDIIPSGGDNIIIYNSPEARLARLYNEELREIEELEDLEDKIEQKKAVSNRR